MNGLSNLEHAGCVHLYVGDGKGKTTAAAGLAARAAGAGKAVLFCQFLKGRATSELASLEKLGIKVMRAKCGTKFVFQMDEDERAQLEKDHADCFREICEAVLTGKAEVIILDEVVDAINCGVIPESGVLKLIAERPSGVELILTGRNPSDALIDASDYYTEFTARKHPYSNGLPPRKGIEY